MLTYNITQNSLTAQQIPCAPPSHLSSSFPSKQWCFYCLFNFAFFRMLCSWNHIVCSILYWFLSLSNIHLNFLNIFFFWLESSFLFIFNHGIIFHCTDCATVCLTIYLLKAIRPLICKFLCWQKFSPLNKYLATWFLDPMVRLFSFVRNC